MKAIVTGAGGMLGQAVMQTGAACGWNMVGKTHKELDITDHRKVAEELLREKPDALINCAGIVKSRQVDGDMFYKVNSLAPLMMADLCTNNHIDMVQISTDCVFRGNAGPYDESSSIDANDTYGMSKALGELDNKHLTIRTSFVGFGNYGLLNWLIHQEGRVPGYKNCKWNGLVVNELAEEIIFLVAINAKGLIHVHGQDVTKYDILEIANRVLGLGLTIVPVDEPVEDRRLRSIRADNNTEFPSFENQMIELLDEYLKLKVVQ